MQRLESVRRARVATRRSAFAMGAAFALASTSLYPASAQIVISGSGQDNVIIDMSVLDSLLGGTGTSAPLDPSATSALPGMPQTVPQAAPSVPVTAAPLPPPDQRKSSNPRPAATAPSAPKPVAATPKPAAKPTPAPVVAKAPPSVPPRRPATAALAAQLVPVPPATPEKAQVKAESVPIPPSAPENTPVTAAPTPAPQATTGTTAQPQAAAPAPVESAAATQPETKPAESKPAEQAANTQPATSTVTVASTSAPTSAPAAPPAVEVAAITTAPAAVLTDGNGSLAFAAGSSELGVDVRAMLDAVAKRLLASPSERMQIRAFASAPDDNGGAASRLSLQRALAVRNYLIELGVHKTRLDTRALGARANDGPADRVDLVILQ